MARKPAHSLDHARLGSFRAIDGDASDEYLPPLERVWDPDNVLRPNRNIRP